MAKKSTKKVSAPKKKGDEKGTSKDSTGKVSPRLQRQMGDALAKIFEDAGTKLYTDTIIVLKEDLEKVFGEAIGGLKGTVKEEMGNMGLTKASKLFKPWVQELVEEVIQFGLKEIGGALEDLASSAAAEFSKSEDEVSKEEEDLFGAEEEPEDVEEVEEEAVAPPAEEEEEPVPAEEETPEAPPLGVPEPAPAVAPAPASYKYNPFKPRVWVSKKPVSTKTANSHLKLTIEQVVEAAGGLETLRTTAKTAMQAYDRLMKTQKQLVTRLASQYNYIEGVSPLEALDWSNQYWLYPVSK